MSTFVGKTLGWKFGSKIIITIERVMFQKSTSQVFHYSTLRPVCEYNVTKIFYTCICMFQGLKRKLRSLKIKNVKCLETKHCLELQWKRTFHKNDVNMIDSGLETRFTDIRCAAAKALLTA